jgi:hypothetical protein
MRTKRQILFNKDYSLIDQKLALTNTNAVIGIYGCNNSRSIYIESRNEECSITKYVISFAEEASKWAVNSLKPSIGVSTEIRELEKKSHIHKVVRVSNEDMHLFKNVLDQATKEFISNSEQDYYIKKALEGIGQDSAFLLQAESLTLL